MHVNKARMVLVVLGLGEVLVVSSQYNRNLLHMLLTLTEPIYLDKTKLPLLQAGCFAVSGSHQ